MTPWIFGFGLLAPSTDLKGHVKYFGEFGHICQLIQACMYMHASMQVTNCMLFLQSAIEERRGYE